MTDRIEDNAEYVKYIAKRVIEFAIYEYNKGPGNNEKQKSNYLSAKRFLMSEWFDDLCILLGLQSKYFKRKIPEIFT